MWACCFHRLLLLNTKWLLLHQNLFLPSQLIVCHLFLGSLKRKYKELQREDLPFVVQFMHSKTCPGLLYLITCVCWEQNHVPWINVCKSDEILIRLSSMSSVIVRKVIFKKLSLPYRASKQSLSHLVSSNSCQYRGVCACFYGNFYPLVCSFMQKFQQIMQPQTVQRSQGFSCCCMQQE